jgi:hypothetical protein
VSNSSTKQRPISSRIYPPGGFDVTAVIGHVEFSEVGEMTPYEAAFALIAKHDATQGLYTFPHEDGGTVNVSVEIVIPQRPDIEDTRDF